MSEDILSKKMHWGALYDCYGGLLTEKQTEIMALYCDQDIGVSEIAELLEITRQAVSISLRKTADLLEAYETTLGMIRRREQTEQLLQELVDICSTTRVRDQIVEKIEEWHLKV